MIVGKIKLCYENSELIEGNYSIVPFLLSKEESTILKFPFIEGLLDFLSICLSFHEVVQKFSYLIDIQRTIILSIVDEQYCLISTLTFVLSAFKHAVNYVNEDLDTTKLVDKLSQVENSYVGLYKKLMELFKKASKLASLFEHNQFELSPKVIEHVRNIEVGNKKIR